MSSPRNQIISLIEQGIIPEEKIPEAIAVTGVLPTGSDWRRFADRLLLWSGGLALAFSILFFIAWNWARIGYFFKFGLVEICIISAIIVYCKTADGSVAGKVSLMAATICLGVLLALYGQTYQTGADPWQLFFNWALLMLPWAFISRFPAIWVIWLFLINISIILYLNTFSRLFYFFSSHTEIYWYLFLFNTIALACWEVAAGKWNWLAQRWPVRLLASGSGSALTWLAILSIIVESNRFSNAGILVWPLWIAGMWFVYRKVRLDLFMLAAGCLSGIVVTTTFLGKQILGNGEPASFLFLAILVAGMGAGSAFWLKKVNREARS